MMYGFEGIRETTKFNCKEYCLYDQYEGWQFEAENDEEAKEIAAGISQVLKTMLRGFLREERDWRYTFAEMSEEMAKRPRLSAALVRFEEDGSTNRVIN